jgi:ADP-ribosyl-[dinitrogen reductase] hydrolase
MVKLRVSTMTLFAVFRMRKMMLGGGSDVMVHCRGGLGRAEAVAARLLIELGTDPETAITKVRQVGSGAIETYEQ